MKKQVITYQLAYDTRREVTLCVDCSERDDIADVVGSLGPVQHGLHEGYCDLCEQETDDDEEV